VKTSEGTANHGYLHQLVDERPADGAAQRCPATCRLALVGYEFADIERTALPPNGTRHVTHSSILRNAQLFILCLTGRFILVIQTIFSPNFTRKCSTCQQDATAGAAAGYGSSQCRPQQRRRAHVEVGHSAEDEEGGTEAVCAAHVSNTYAAGAAESVGAAFVGSGCSRSNARAGIHERGSYSAA
jgi:hypothetical protein